MLRSRLIWIATALAVLAGVFLLGRQVATYIPRFATWVESLGALGPIVFVGGFIVGTVLFVPGSIMTLTGGALFGIVRGTIYVFIGASLGSMAAFLVSRHFIREAFARRIAGKPRFRALDDAIKREGRKIVFLLRLSPAVPFNLLNYMLGVSSVRLRDFVMACAGMLPVTLLWVYYGKMIGDVARVVTGSSTIHGRGYWAMLAVGLVATIIVTAVITRAARRALESSVEQDKT
jgi:uncharacterized membrane protein YdjX (TVP38/TMEM64 family)